jgi:holo-[acyl-carrier protein] synthase
LSDLIYGIGTDICSISRLEQSLIVTPELKQRLFHSNELELRPASLAARFAAKEALAKALGDPRMLSWNEIEIVKDELGKPSFQLHGKAEENLRSLGNLRIHLSLSHESDVAIATVVLESN